MTAAGQLATSHPGESLEEDRWKRKERLAGTRFQFCRSLFPLLVRCFTASCLAGCCLAQGQTYNQYNKELRISPLPSLTARSTDASDVLAAAAEIIFRDPEVCCGKKSALGDRVRLADPMSLEAIANKLRGRNVLSDGRAFIVTAEYMSPPSVNVGQLITAVTEKHAPLMEWDSHLYVVFGVIYYETFDSSTGARTDTLDKLLLLDPRFSDERREVSFDRTTDWEKVQALLILVAVPE
jgi:hypothetical protein